MLQICGALCFVAIVIQFARKEYCDRGGDDDSSQGSFDEMEEEEDSYDSIHLQEPQIARIRDHRSSRRQYDRNERRNRDLYDV
eukprot:scaffold6714_cov75-Skeletonema_dohrnii-CCMP3373.AAC.1